LHILSEIHVYPVKSLGGFSLTEAIVERRGLRHDRRWMLVDEDGKFVTQREIPKMALLSTAIEPDHLVVFSKQHPAERVWVPLEIPLESLPKQMVEIWSDRCAAHVLPGPINEWFSDILEQKLRLVHMPETTHRWADGRYAPKGQYVSFADGFCYLIIGQASLDDLNSRLAEPLPMNRFRPNLVFTGGDPFEEDDWSDFQVGSVPFRAIKSCGRCPITTTDQDTAQRAAEPLQTLATYRRRGNKVLFGRDVVWMGEGDAQIQVGDKIEKAG